jgi:hypothetical protein
MATMLIDCFANSDKKPERDDCSWGRLAHLNFGR